MLTPVYNRSDYLDERMKMYGEWIRTAQVGHLNTSTYEKN
jgi:hypothetical protein